MAFEYDELWFIIIYWHKIREKNSIWSWMEVNRKEEICIFMQISTEHNNNKMFARNRQTTEYESKQEK